MGVGMGGSRGGVPPAGGIQGLRGPAGQGNGAAQPGMGSGRGMDRSGDGLISRDEIGQEEQILQRMQERWQTAARNGDGVLDQSEFAAVQRQLRHGGDSGQNRDTQPRRANVSGTR